MVHFVGAGPGAPDLITLRGAALLERADQVIYAGSLVNPMLLERCRAEIPYWQDLDPQILAEVSTERCQAPLRFL